MDRYQPNSEYLGGRDPFDEDLDDREYTVNIIGASSEEEEDIFVRKGLIDDPKIEDESTGDKKDQNDSDGLPIDRGWAWLVLAGCFLNVVIMVGYGRGLAILFVEYLNLFQASAAKTTLLMGVMAGVYSFSSLISMNVLINMLGIRKTVFLGASISTVAMVTAIFPTSITYLIAVHSVLIGIGHSMLFGPGLVLIGQYFNKRRGLATAVASSGVSCGSSIFPVIIKYLLDEYGLRGSMIILTGITMNLFVGASLFRPLSFFKKRIAKQMSSKVGTIPVKTPARIEMKDIGKLNPEKFLSVDSVTSEMLGRSPMAGFSLLSKDSSDSLHIVRRLSRPLSASFVLKSRMASMYASNAELGSAPVLNVVNEEESEVEEEDLEEQTTSRKCIFFVRRVFSTLDFSLFKHPVFLSVIVYSFFGITVALLPVYLPVLAKEKGISQKDAAFFLMITGGLDFFGRLFYGFFADLRIVPVNVIMAVGLIITGTATHLTMFYNSYVSLLVYAVIVGLSSGSYFSLIPVAIVEIMGLEHLAKTLGFVSVFHGISMAIAHPILGSLKDMTGSYTVSFNYIGCGAYIGALTLLLVPWLRRCVKRKTNLQTLYDKVTEL